MHIQTALAAAVCCGLSLSARAACLESYSPPRSPYYCTTSNPAQVEACRREAEQFHMREEASYRQAWEQRQQACQARERQQEALRAETARREAEEAERKRKAAENDRYIAEQRAKQAAADLERQRTQASAAAAQQKPASRNDVNTAAASGFKMTAGWAWLLVILPLIGILKMVLTNDAPARMKFGITFAVPLVTSLIGWSLGFTNDITLAEFALLQAPNGAGLFAAIIAKTG